MEVFFIIEPKFFNFIDGDDMYLEREPLEQAVSEGEFFAYKHNGFWQCMDTKRDKDNLEEIYLKGAPCKCLLKLKLIAKHK